MGFQLIGCSLPRVDSFVQTRVVASPWLHMASRRHAPAERAHVVGGVCLCGLRSAPSFDCARAPLARVSAATITGACRVVLNVSPRFVVAACVSRVAKPIYEEPQCTNETVNKYKTKEKRQNRKPVENPKR